jgi:hypothetical protein|tara:strand:- start:52 stop:321 length:270 start_codon:yes stop_codon:yes gene_type:complete
MDYLQKALAHFNSGKSQWYGWRKDYTGDKRMSYENLILNNNTATMPTEAEVNAKIQELKDAETQKENDKISAQNKLKALGLTDAEIEAL